MEFIDQIKERVEFVKDILKIGPRHFVGIDIGQQPAAHRRHLGLEGAKQPIPDNEHIPIVTIHVLGVRAMVCAMV